MSTPLAAGGKWSGAVPTALHVNRSDMLSVCLSMSSARRLAAGPRISLGNLAQGILFRLGQLRLQVGVLRRTVWLLTRPARRQFLDQSRRQQLNRLCNGNLRTKSPWGVACSLFAASITGYTPEG